MNYDIIVVGAGHAGVEAALASARIGMKTALINLYEDKVASAPCNPSIGGSAKGIVVREIDALGGQMGKTTDICALQMKLLNSSRGPGVWAYRAQIDKLAYSREMKKIVLNEKNIDFIVDAVDDVLIENSKIKGVILESKKILNAKIVILTTGTYLKSEILLGHERKSEGPNGQRTVSGISNFLNKNDFSVFRFKTGTPPRVLQNSIDLSKARPEFGTNKKISFSFLNNFVIDFDKQLPCYLIHSTPETKKIIEKNLTLSAMYSGKTFSIGPRYCPSFEDKIVRFSNKDTHQIFLEPESLELDTFYVQGLSTSMPINVQEKMLKSLPGFENVIVKHWAYAIEYDCIDPMQLNLTLESKKIDGLYFAGQINGTSGYEEAAGQGLIAGINACNKLKNVKPLILKRSESYIGLMIDDLINKGVNEPYRLLTSRAEYRLSLRNDNSEIRLKKYGYDAGLVKQKEYDKYLNFIDEISMALEFLKNEQITSKSEFADILLEKNNILLKSKISLFELLKQSRINADLIFDYHEILKNLNDNQKQYILINLRFEGYIKKENESIEKMNRQESKKIPKTINYDDVTNIATEARVNLKKVKPATVGQACRVRGVNPSDIQMLLFYLKHKFTN